MLSFNFISVIHRTSMNILHNLHIIIYSLLCTLLLELVFSITFCVVLHVDCCLTLGSLTNLVLGVL
jgi:hypothetical protein